MNKAIIRYWLTRVLWVLLHVAIFAGVIAELARGQDWQPANDACQVGFQCGPNGCSAGRCIPSLQGGYQRPAPQQAAVQQQAQPQAVAKDSCVVQIVSRAADKQKLGSGAVVNITDGVATIVTCAHILEEGYVPAVRYADGSEQPAEILAVDALSDSACLRAKAVAGVGSMGVTDDPAVGETVGWRGYAGAAKPNGEAYSIYTGGSTKVVGYEGSKLVVSGKVFEGCSGGPIYTARGLVAILSRCEGEQGQNWQTIGPCASRIKKMLDGVFAKQPPATTVAAQQIASNAQPSQPAAVQSGYDDRPIKSAIEELRNAVAERAKEKSVAAKIADAQQHFAAQAEEAAEGKVRPVRDLAETLRKRVSQHDTDLQDVPVAFERIKVAEKKLAAVPGADKVRDVVVSVVAEQGPTLVAAAEPLFKGAVTAGLTALGISCPVAGVGAWLAFALAKRGAKKIGEQVASRGTTTEIPAASLPPERPTAPSNVTVRDGSTQPLPTAAELWTNSSVERQNRYVRIQETDAAGEAYKEAVARFASANPSLAPSCEAIEGLAALILHGKRVSQKLRTGRGEVSDPIIVPNGGL